MKSFITHCSSTLFLLLSIFSNMLYAQENNKVFLDKNLKPAAEADATYYRLTDSPVEVGGTMPTKIYYLGGELYFEGNVTYNDLNDPSKNLLTDVCKWYYESGRTMYEATYNKEGKYNGSYTSWYPTGKKQKTAEYKNGLLVNNKYTLYDDKEQTQRIFNETFDNNQNKWDINNSAESVSNISNGVYSFSSKSKNQIASVINIPVESDNFSVEAQIKKMSGNPTARYGLMLGMKDMDNFLYFIIDNAHYKIAGKIEGIYTVLQDWTSMIKLKKEDNSLIKVLKVEDEIFFSINGNAIDRTRSFMLPGNNFGIFVLDPCDLQVDNFIVKEFNPILINDIGVVAPEDKNIRSSGSGFILSKKGYVATNFHVINSEEKIEVEVNLPTGRKTFKAQVVVKDEQNDLAILKISDSALVSLPEIPYAIRSGGFSVGESVFALGYPLVMQGMGKEIKFTDGKISSKTGYKNELSNFQVSVPIQPGNSGGPLFDNDGNLIGITTAIHRLAQNATYAVKTDFLKVLMGVLPETVSLDEGINMKGKSTEEKIKILSPFVAFIKIK